MQIINYYFLAFRHTFCCLTIKKIMFKGIGGYLYGIY